MSLLDHILADSEGELQALVAGQMRGAASRVASSGTVIQTIPGYALECFEYDNNSAVATFMFTLPDGWDNGAVSLELIVMPLVAAGGDIVFNVTPTWDMLAAQTQTLSAGASAIELITMPSNQITSDLPKTLFISVARNIGVDTFETPKVGGNVKANVALLGVNVLFTVERYGGRT